MAGPVLHDTAPGGPGADPRKPIHLALSARFVSERFLIEDGVGADARFWKLAQSLSALYPRAADEKRWVDGLLARKKGLGL